MAPAEEALPHDRRLLDGRVRSFRLSSSSLSLTLSCQHRPRTGPVSHQRSQVSAPYISPFRCSSVCSIFFPSQFGIGGSDRQSTLILGLVNAAPYFVCCTVACWCTGSIHLAHVRRKAR